MADTCFVISPIGDEGSPTRIRSDKILKYIIKPAAESCGLEVQRADDISEPGLITTQVIQRILDSKIVVADLTERNPNVFYELAIRHVIRKPYVQIIQFGEKLPFDVAAIRTIEVDYQDIERAERAKEDIRRQIETSIKEESIVESPISTAIDLESLRRSGDPERRQLADVAEIMTDLGRSVMAYNDKLDFMMHALKGMSDAMADKNLAGSKYAIEIRKTDYGSYALSARTPRGGRQTYRTSNEEAMIKRIVEWSGWPEERVRSIIESVGEREVVFIGLD